MIKETNIDELYTNGAYKVMGHIEKRSGEFMLIGICTESSYTAVKKVGEKVEWPILNRGKARHQQFKSLKQLRNEKINSLL